MSNNVYVNVYTCKNMYIIFNKRLESVKQILWTTKIRIINKTLINKTLISALQFDNIT